MADLLVNPYNGYPTRRIESYKEAKWFFDQKKCWRGIKDRPFAGRNTRNRRMRMLEDGSIEFEYMKHVVCVWHPDNTLIVQPDSRPRWGGLYFALPSGVVPCLERHIGRIIFYGGLPYCYGTHWDTNRESIRVVRANTPVRFERRSNPQRPWQPIDEDNLEPFEWWEVDKTKARQVREKCHTTDLLHALRAKFKLGDDKGRAHSDMRAAAKAMMRGDLTLAMNSISAASNYRWDEATSRYVNVADIPCLSQLQRLRNHLYVEAGICSKRSEKVLTWTEWRRVERKLKDFGHP